MAKKYLVTRHRGAVTWAAREGVKARKIEQGHFEVQNVQPGDVIIGTLPIQLVAELQRRGGTYWHLTMDVPANRRGDELSADDMTAFGARLVEYHVVERGERTSPSPEAVSPAEGRKVLMMCIATGQQLPNVLPMLQLPWDQLVVFASKEMAVKATALKDIADEKAADRVTTGEQVCELRPLKEGTSAELRVQALGEVERLMKKWPDHQLLFNFTGGLKLMTRAFDDALRGRADLIYCDTAQGRIDFVEPQGKTPEPLQSNLLTLDAFLRTQGHEITRLTRPPSSDQTDVVGERQPLTLALALGADKLGEIRLRKSEPYSPGNLLTAIHFAATLAKSTRNKPFAPVQTLEGLGQDRKMRAKSIPILNCLVDQVLWTRLEWDGDDARVTFKDDDAAGYLAGGYLEEYVQLAIRSLQLPETTFAANVGIKDYGVRSEMNELDLACVWQNKLLVIECKAGLSLLLQKSQDALNKLDVLRRVGGTFGSAWLVTSVSLNSDINEHRDAIDRAGAYGISVLSGKEALLSLRKTMAEHLGVAVPARAWPPEPLDIFCSGGARPGARGAPRFKPPSSPRVRR